MGKVRLSSSDLYDEVIPGSGILTVKGDPWVTSPSSTYLVKDSGNGSWLKTRRLSWLKCTFWEDSPGQPLKTSIFVQMCRSSYLFLATDLHFSAAHQITAVKFGLARANAASSSSPFSASLLYGA
ncbi:hypothetical protein AVEN_259712-1 [Araneus ventricosus]|uniref:Uncharacterized protein n=1 Tax=Araneus ventricosus TaxID=182803 RepID=A0A4Y2CS09_ARAVE|nr:hypothetical protein AVEN_259712-1 [Araneus ventricosus]